MAKITIKDIQVKKKTTIKQPVVNLNLESKTILKKEPDFIKSNFTNDDDTEFENYKKIKKTLNKNNRNWIKVTIFIIVPILVVIFCLYYFTFSYLVISPKKTKITVSYNISQSSWVNPIKTQVMVIKETIPNINELNLELEKEKINTNLNSQKVFNIPKGYLHYGSCSSGTIFSNEIIDEKTKTSNLTGRESVLIINEQSLLDYINKQGDYSDSNIKDISGLKCSLNTNIEEYTQGDSVNGLSYNISGEIIFEKKIDQDYFKKLIAGNKKKNIINELKITPIIEEFNFSSKPFNFMPILPKKLNNISIIYKESVLISK